MYVRRLWWLYLDIHIQYYNLLIFISVQCHPSRVTRETFLSKLFDVGPNTEERTLKVCPSEIKDREFLIIGHSGGDPHQACENTIAATKSALKRSIAPMNGLRLKNQCNLSR